MPLFLFLLFFLSATQNVDGMGQSGVAILDHMEVMHGEKRSNESDFLKISFHQPIIHPEPSCSSLVTCSWGKHASGSFSSLLYSQPRSTVCSSCIHLTVAHFCTLPLAASLLYALSFLVDFFLLRPTSRIVSFEKIVHSQLDEFGNSFFAIFIFT